MTDFFADLEQEIRAAHPRRSRPVVPVRGIAATVAVAAMLVAVVLAAGALTTTESEVAAPPPERGWTEYAPLDCAGSGKVVDGRIPDELVDRFALLRGDSAPVDLPAANVPDVAAEVVSQSLRLLEGPEGRRYVFAVVRMGEEKCEPGAHGVCVISLQSENGACEVPVATEPFSTWLVEDYRDGRRILVAVADDDVAEVKVDETVEVPMQANVGFAELDEGEQEPSVEPLP